MDTLHADGDRLIATADARRAAEEYIEAMNAACANLLGQLSLAAQRLDEDGPFPSAAATHRRLTRQFLDGQRALLRERAAGIATVSEIDAEARAMAEAVVRDACALAGIVPSTPGASVGDLGGPSDDGLSGAIADLQRLLDDWWRSELASSADLVDRAREAADLMTSLARIEAGEILANADVPSPLPPPDLGFLERDLLPPEVTEAMASADPTGLVEVCDALLLTLGGVPSHSLPVGDAEVVVLAESPESAWAPPGFPPPTIGGLAEPTGAPIDAAPAGGDETFHHFWGEGPESHSGRSRGIVLQAVVTMLAFTGVLALVMAAIG